jgi:indole-3-glycerol phosphate synthase
MVSATDRRLAASKAEAGRLEGQPIQEITPSRRDLLQYVTTQRSELAVLARLTAAPRDELVARAVALDEAEVAGLVVSALDDGISSADLCAVSTAVTAPILRDVPILDATQIYFARLHGADAVVVPLAEHDESALRELAAVASSLHMTVVVEIGDETQLDAAQILPRAALGLYCATAGGGIDVQRTVALSRGLPQDRVLIALADSSGAAEADLLRGHVDALVATALSGSVDLQGALARLAQG